MARTKIRPVRSGGINHASDRFWRGGWGRGDGDSSDWEHEDEFQLPTGSARLGLWLFLISLTSMFAVLSVIYLTRLSQKPQFPFATPPILWVNTLVLLLSSGTCQLALRAVRQEDESRLKRWLGATLCLGLLFLVGQLYGWSQLLQQGFHLQKHFFSDFFYLITGTHALHLLVGLLLLAYIWFRSLRNAYTAKYHLPVELTTLYWHFLDALWIWLFVLLKFL